MTRLLVLLAALVLLATPAAGAGAAAGEAADATAAAPPGEPTFFSWAYWQEESGSSTSRSEVFRNGGLFLAALFGLGFAFWRARIATKQAEAAAERADAAIDQARAANEQASAANEQARIAEQGHITDRFSTAVEHLGSEQLPVRLGGIYALWRLIKDSPERDVISVIDILCAFVRYPPHEPVGPLEPDAEVPTVRPDAQTIVSLIGNEKAFYRALLPAGYRLDLRGANLTHANLRDADFTRADLTGADLWKANLKDANLTGANLKDAVLAGANLKDAAPRNADLRDAVLEAADLTGANLTGADITRTHLMQDQLDSACIREGGAPPALPEGLKPPQKVCEPGIP